MTEREKAGKKYSLASNLLAALKDLRLIGRRYYLYLFLDLISQIAAPFLLILLPAQVVRLLEGQVDYQLLLGEIALLIGLVLVLNLIRTYTHKRLEEGASMIAEIRYWRRIEKQAMSCDLMELEDNTQRELWTEVLHSVASSDGMGGKAGIVGLYIYGILLLVSLGGFLLYGAFAGSLNLLLLLILLITAACNCYAKSRAIRYQFQHIDKFWENTNRFWYLKEESINMKKAKDIRMYHLYGWFQKAMDKNLKEAAGAYADVQQHNFYGNLAVRLTALVRDGAAYGFLIWCLVEGRMDVAGFVAYLGIVAGFSSWTEQIVENYTYLGHISKEISVIRGFLKEEPPESAGEELQVPEMCHSIRFEDVSFGYGEELLFEHFSLELHAGEKVALVGMNGAGKTTLMKLLCGLYPLKGGRICIDGEDIAGRSREDQYLFISILFQDVQTLPFSIGKNVSCSWSKDEREGMEETLEKNEFVRAFEKLDAGERRQEAASEERIVECLKRAGLWEKVQSLPRGIHTNLTKILSPDGINLSGGETQRLMLARALYKDAPILILDEPTAALDPIAESELYEEYAKLCRNKISVFISHRLSSTRFCDRILYLEQGKIVEEGTHEALMARNGKYADMYRIQAHYYQKEVQRREAGI